MAIRPYKYYYYLILEESKSFLETTKKRQSDEIHLISNSIDLPYSPFFLIKFLIV